MIPSLSLESVGYKVALLSVPRFVPSFLSAAVVHDLWELILQVKQRD